MKAQRWYERREDGTYAVYDAPSPEHATSVSLVSDLAYYRRTFKLQPCWEPSYASVE